MRSNAKSPFKWAGSKLRVVNEIKDHLEAKEFLIEPFCGSCSVMLNTNYNRYFLNDSNEDLITAYKLIQQDHESYIRETRKLFNSGYNTKEMFLQLRADFNSSSCKEERAVLFLYINRHCYNGLFRVNKSGYFNVSFGKYINPYYPQKEIELFAEKSINATFTSLDWLDFINKSKINSNCDVYFDPPYIPASKTANFTQYSNCKFNEKDHEKLAKVAFFISKDKGAKVVVSNSNTEKSISLYKNAFKIDFINAKRSIGCKNRGQAPELLATFC